MRSVQFISSKVHGVLDYLMGLLLLLTPNLFGFAEQGGPAVWVPRALGLLTIGLALITDYELGVIRWIPFGLHLLLDFFFWCFLLISPWLLGFSYSSFNVWNPPVNLALVGIIIVFLTFPHRQSAVRGA